MSDNKAVKALEAAIRKCGREGVKVKAVYTWTNDDNSTQTREARA